MICFLLLTVWIKVCQNLEKFGRAARKHSKNSGCSKEILKFSAREIRSSFLNDRNFATFTSFFDIVLNSRLIDNYIILFFISGQYEINALNHIFVTADDYVEHEQVGNIKNLKYIGEDLFQRTGFCKKIKNLASCFILIKFLFCNTYFEKQYSIFFHFGMIWKQSYSLDRVLTLKLIVYILMWTVKSEIAKNIFDK